mgnify:CR=1 FL=1|jgi:hypothetical protein
MNKMHKLVFSLILTAVMLLAGCGNKETTSTSDNETIEMSDEQITALAETKYYGTYKQFTLWNIETNEEVFNIIGRLCVSHDIINDELIITTKIGDNEYIKDRIQDTDKVFYTLRDIPDISSEPYHYEYSMRKDSE